VADPEYFTTAELQALPDCAAFLEASILAAAAYFTAIVEREVGEPFIPRSYTDTLDGNGCTELVLSHAYIRSLTSVTVDGSTVSTSLLSSTAGVLRYSTSGGSLGTVWTAGIGNVVVTYSAGRYTTCPADIKNGVMWATRDRLLSQSDSAGIDIRKTSMTNELGGTTTYLLPGEKRPTGYPDLDALIASYMRNTATFGFA
jgi:hypothetical protein